MSFRYFIVDLDELRPVVGTNNDQLAREFGAQQNYVVIDVVDNSYNHNDEVSQIRDILSL
jgi:hypothetical protein